MSDWNKPTQSAPLSAPDSVHRVDLATTEELGVPLRYFAKSVLGVGGMGEVRLVRDVRIGREIAMKVMLDQDADPQRFLREARVQGQLEHPAIVPVYDLGEGEGEMFFTMKRVRGVTLEQIVADLAAGKGAQTRRKLLSAFVSACLAIDFAHSRGVIHRDLKPANVMLGDFGEVYVLDWGIAKLIDEPDAPVPAAGALRLPERYKTQAGLVLGTLGYMAPEQLRGDALDGRADVYALGAILFELLVLQPLNAGADATELTAATFADPSARIRRLCEEHDIPPELEAICLRAVAGDPAARYPSARALSNALERYLDGDRDLERRRELALGHAMAARIALTSALHDGLDESARKTAMLEAGQALALDPDSREAARTLMQLMTALPKEPPAEVRRELEDARAAAAKTAGKFGALGSLGMLSIAPLLVAMGVRSWLLVALGAACIALSAVTLLAIGRWPEHGRALHVALLLLGAVFIGVLSTHFGPLLSAPMVAVGLATALGFHPHAGRVAPVVIMSAGFLVPLLFGAAGSYELAGNTLIIHAGLTGFPRTATFAYLVVSAVAAVVTVGAYVAAVRRTLERAQEAALVRAWQLRQLVPDVSEKKT